MASCGLSPTRAVSECKLPANDITKIKLYGNDHSPWVQAIMLGLHETGVEYMRSTFPPLEVFKKWGPMMPAASIDDGPWFLESKEILQRLGYSMVSEEDMLAVRRSWSGVMHRADYWPRFFGEFSLASDPNDSFVPRFVGNFLRALTILYFFCLIRFGVIARGYQDPDNHGDAFIEWENRFSLMQGRFLAGDKPDSVDLLLFGIVQCHCSIPVPTLFDLQSDPRLPRTREWIGNMQAHFSNYGSLYSNIYFAPHGPGPKPAKGVDQFAFWLGIIIGIACLPVTIAVSAFFIYRNRNLRDA